MADYAPVGASEEQLTRGIIDASAALPPQPAISHPKAA
jgi:hypothetical protein